MQLFRAVQKFLESPRRQTRTRAGRGAPGARVCGEVVALQERAGPCFCRRRRLDESNLLAGIPRDSNGIAAVFATSHGSDIHARTNSSFIQGCQPALLPLSSQSPVRRFFCMSKLPLNRTVFPLMLQRRPFSDTTKASVDP
jgi:hypothetical protein